MALLIFPKRPSGNFLALFLDIFSPASIEVIHRSNNVRIAVLFILFLQDHSSQNAPWLL